MVIGKDDDEIGFGRLQSDRNEKQGDQGHACLNVLEFHKCYLVMVGFDVKIGLPKLFVMNFFSVDPNVDFVGGADFNLDD